MLAVGVMVDSGALEVPVPKTDEASINRAAVPPAAFMKGSSWEWVPNAVPAKVGTPAGQEIVSAGTVPAFPAKVGGLAGQLTEPFGVPADTAASDPLMVSAGTIPGVPVNDAEMLPAGVMESLPPVVPTSPCAARVPKSVLPSSVASSANPLGHVPESIIKTDPEGIDDVPALRSCHVLLEQNQKWFVSRSM